ncbi:GNAT family N-acetyltransferase [Streptomyces sp. XM4011]|uniref:GNAT family N-acetyltransferase n=1 Tax=Streptomyces sp. XM4011 TaxID=2929780 RepID=UPI001FFB2247|nr:GNAT family N-acetyltransferase [Streptomyces sp. XM4011]MCK1813096.1 GNAT family N-acetyltransferase [Streptomyces sp. XM4011]
MTTTVRPTGPEEPLDRGGRSRAFDIRDNSRPVGALRLTRVPGYGPGTGRIEELEIAPEDRRRGRATVAALAAEEILRGWGCARVEADVPAEATAARGLFTALGYTGRSHWLTQRLPAPGPGLPQGSAVRPMGERDYARWRAAERARLAAGRREQGADPAEAEAHADAVLGAQLPAGHRTEGMALRVLSHHGSDVGTLWLALAPGRLPYGTDGYVFHVEVAAEHRGRGHGRTLLGEAGRLTRAAGGTRLGLSVDADNAAARRLYDGLGYRPVAERLGKSLR